MFSPLYGFVALRFELLPAKCKGGTINYTFLLYVVGLDMRTFHSPSEANSLCGRKPWYWFLLEIAQLGYNFQFLISTGMISMKWFSLDTNIVCVQLNDVLVIYSYGHFSSKLQAAAFLEFNPCLATTFRCLNLYTLKTWTYNPTKNRYGGVSSRAWQNSHSLPPFHMIKTYEIFTCLTAW